MPETELAKDVRNANIPAFGLDGTVRKFAGKVAGEDNGDIYITEMT